MSTATPLDRIGVGIDTARYGHRVTFLKPDRLPAAKPLTVLENRASYRALQQRLQRLHEQHPQAHFHIRIDAAGQYAANLERFLRQLSLPMTVSIGEPKRNKDYRKAHFPKRTTDDTESQAMARFAVVEQPAATAGSAPAMVLLREVAGRLQAKVKQSTQAINRLHNILARVFPELATLTNNLAAAWVLNLLDKYPTVERIAQARSSSLEKIRYLSEDLATQVRRAAQQSVASVHGDVAAALVRDLVAQVRHTQQAEEGMRQLLKQAFADLPPSGHLQIETIPGIGPRTAAVLVAKIVDIDRFATPAGWLLRRIPRTKHFRRGQTGSAAVCRHAAHVAQRERFGPRLPVERGTVGHSSQPSCPRSLPSPPSQRQAWGCGHGSLHAEITASCFRRLEDQPAF